MQVADKNDLDLAIDKNQIYIGRSGSLKLSLINTTGETLALAGGKINLVFPSAVFGDGDVGKFGVSGLPAGWTRSVTGQVLQLTPAVSAAIEPGVPLSFELDNVISSLSKPLPGTVSAKYVNLDVFPTQVSRPLALANPPEGLKDLRSAVALELEDRVIYRSYDLANPIANKLVLHLRNMGREALVKGDWGKAEPTITLTVVTGEGAGALTRAHGTGVDSPLLIEAGIHQSYASQWQQPTATKQLQTLCWTFSPVKDVTKEVLGAGEGAAVAFELSNIVTVLTAGHTQLYAQFANFPGYADCLFALDVEKRDPVPGVLGFYADPVDIDRGQSTALKWATFAVSRLALEYLENGVIKRLSSANPADALPLNPLKATTPFIVSPKVTTTYTLHAYDLQGLETPLGGQLTVSVAQPDLSIRSIKATPNPVDFSKGPVDVQVDWDIENFELVGKVELDPLGVQPRGAKSARMTLTNTTNMLVRAYAADGPLADTRSLQVQSLAESLVGKTYGYSDDQTQGDYISWTKRFWVSFTSPFTMTMVMQLQDRGRYFERITGFWSLQDGVIEFRSKELDRTYAFTLDDGVLLLTRTPWTRDREQDGWGSFDGDWMRRVARTMPMKPGFTPPKPDRDYTDAPFSEEMRNNPSGWWRRFIGPGKEG
jgi:hypothetical protein